MRRIILLEWSSGDLTVMIGSLTPSETAVVAGVSVRDVHRMIDEHILPEALYTSTQTRSFKSEACALISFYFRAANRLTSEERQRTIARASESTSDPATIQDEFLTIDLTSFYEEVEERLERLQAAQGIVVSDPEILSGTLVIRGTRVPVYDVAASVVAGIPMERILAAYPSLKRKQVELAALYVEANPQRGRPRQKTSLPPNGKVISRRTGTISKPQ
jgi:uncharacterized protein (DUF433 family)